MNVLSKMLKNNYHNSCIYILSTMDGKLNYIGSTTQGIKKRLSDHEEDAKTFNKGSKNIILSGQDYYIKKLENVFCNASEELHKREQFYINLYGIENLCNKKRAYKIKNTDKKKYKCICGYKYMKHTREKHKKSITHKNKLSYLAVTTDKDFYWRLLEKLNNN